MVTILGKTCIQLVILFSLIKEQQHTSPACEIALTYPVNNMTVWVINFPQFEKTQAFPPVTLRYAGLTNHHKANVWCDIDNLTKIKIPFQAKMTRFTTSSFYKVRICCISLSSLLTFSIQTEYSSRHFKHNELTNNK